MPVKKVKVLRNAKGEYHHGDLKSSLKEAALRLVRDRGPRGFSLNEASRLAGVSVAAPYRHFDDKDALLAEIARDGYELLEREIQNAVEKADDVRDRLVESGMAYLRFARNHADYFNVMFHSGLDRAKYPDIQRSVKAGLGVVHILAQQYERTKELAELRAVSAWALVHGLATLDHDGALILAFAKKIVAEHPALNVLINNSGIMRLEDFVNHPEDLSTPGAVITTNLLGPIRLTSALLPHLTKQSHAVIMNVTSSLAFAPLAFAATYCATKSALHSWTESLRYQLGRTGTQVIELVPPYLQTELTGSRQASDPMAMPLNDFIAESMQILESQPGVAEVLVENAKPQRFAAEGGIEAYNAVVKGFNDAVAKMMSA